MINKKNAGIVSIIIIILILGIYLINVDASQKASEEKNVMSNETGINESYGHKDSGSANLTNVESNKSVQSQNHSNKSCCK